ncbi:MAG: asparagine synthase (glutamine-hydrolyzing) [Planctomycetaceae bacterium]|nr:asparagine synthase (glutamine-hydrolyzing) [Planctomycetaceae bacterium]
MCGIAGILFRDAARPVAVETLHRLGDAIRHRGPDDDGYFVAPGIGLVHRRLAIIDLDGGRQPIGNEDDSMQVVFNGEIYNFPELRRDLQSRGHVFRTQTDTEVLVHLYEECGERLVEKLRGMFALAIWDGRRKRLFLARDRVGIKPLYFYRDAEKFIFASELKGILAVDGVDRSIHAPAVDDYLAYGFVPGESSIFSRIEKLPPAHRLSVSAERLQETPRRYWELGTAVATPSAESDWERSVRDKVAETIRVHRLADVPVGTFLSGGIDSGIVTASLARSSSDAVRTFSIGFPDPRFNELPTARLVARRYRCDHHEEICDLQAGECLEELSQVFDEPFADSSAVPTLLLSRLAARHVKVVLSGDGGDEAFAGYSRYAHDLREHAWRRRFPRWFRRSVLGSLGSLWPKADWAPRPLRLKTFLENLALEPGAAYANTLAACRASLRRRLCAPLADSLNNHRPEQRFADAFRGTDVLHGMIGVDVRYHLPDDYLTKVDRASMAYGLEVRPPFVDHELLELVWQIPAGLKILGSDKKRVLKRAFAEDLPPEVLRKPKQGFEVPIDAWLRGPLRDRFESLVLAPKARVGEFIDPSVAASLYRRHLRGVGRHGQVLWSLLVLASWSETYLAPALSSQLAAKVS